MEQLPLKSFLEERLHLLDQQRGVILISAAAYPFIFFAQIFKRLRSVYANFMVISLAENSLADVYRMLSTSFLGATFIFWLKDCSALSDEHKKELYSYIAEYEGPHTALLFIPSEIVLQHAWRAIAFLVTLPEHIDYDTARCCMTALYGDGGAGQKQKVLRFIEGQRQPVPFEAFFMVIEYCSVTNVTSNAEMRQIITLISMHHHSLFSLSQYFFEKKMQPLLTEWVAVESEYDPVFWPAFWSDQCLRAIEYIIAARSGMNAVELKTKSTRLPFSFTKTQWRLYAVDELRRAHGHLYDLDVRLKNGSNPWIIEQFYTEFVHDGFK
jgi:hypothetical protein